MNGWRPLLDGQLAERAWETVESIAQVIKPAAAPSAPPPDQDGLADAAAAAGGGPESAAPEAAAASAEPPEMDELARLAHQEQHPNVAGGVAGRALFFAYLSKAAQGREEDGEIAAALLERATDALSTVPLTPDLYGGFAGVAWAAEHLYSPRFVAADGGAASASSGGIDGPAALGTEALGTEAMLEADPLVEIDEALQSFLDHTPWTADYDLIRGLTGFGVYALERLPQPSALACLAMVVDRLGETAERGPQGITWHTAPELLPDWQRELFPTGYYNLGVAHGMPGTIAMLAAASAAAERMAARAAGDTLRPGLAHLAPLAPLARTTARRARDLVQGAVQWLQAQRLPADDQAWFGSSFSSEIKPTKSRLAWCYGDPGIAASLLVAARACREPAWESYAIELGLHAAARPVATAMVRDAGLCHGSAGLGHLFNRLYQETGEAGFATASRSWFSEALDFRQPGLGLAGYRAFSVGDDKTTTVWHTYSGFLEGVAGIGLALLGGLSDFEPAWDRLLLLSAGDLD